MTITAKSVYRDTGNFFRNQSATILLLALLCAFITTLLSHLFLPSDQQMKLLLDSYHQAGTESAGQIAQTLSADQQAILLQMIVALIAMLIVNTLLTGGILLLIQRVNSGQRISALQAIGASTPLLPRLFILKFIAIFIQIGFAFLILPALFFCVLLAMAPVILLQNNSGIFAALRDSCRLTWRNIWLITPAVLAWLGVRVLLFFAPLSQINKEILDIIIHFINNIAYILLIIYLFRLYMLLRQTTP